MEGFNEGYDFFQKNAGSIVSASLGEKYVDNVNSEIDKLIDDLNSFKGYKTGVGALKGDIAEFWHSDTFNINAKVSGSSNSTTVDRSHEFASADITSDFGKDFGLKYYKTGVESAKQQAKSIFERYKEYRANGGEDTLEVFLSKRGLNDLDTMMNDPIYTGQIRVIPKDQLEEAEAWLRRKIEEELSKRPELAHKYEETLELLTDRIKDDNGTESVPLSKEDAEKLARIAKEGKISKEVLDKLGISTEDLISFEYILKQAFEAGTTAAIISLVLKTAPEIIKAMQFLIDNGELEENCIKRLGFAALQGSSEGFLRGTVSAAITTACKAGIWGEQLKIIEPSIVAMATVLVMNTMKNSYMVAIDKMTRKELEMELIEELFISTCSLIGGTVTQSVIEIPVLGFMLGSFVGSVAGSFVYSAGYSKAISFCKDTGFTMFRLVDQDYELPEEIQKRIGIDVFEYEKMTVDTFEPDTMIIDSFTPDSFMPDSMNSDDGNPIVFLRRGVIGINKIGYAIN